MPAVFHYAPLHYLHFIARRGALLSKQALLQSGFVERHFRSTSCVQDVQRGFSNYVHLTLDAHPPILRAKLNGGFPHFEIAFPATHFDECTYLLCRFNIAKTRYFRGAKQAPPESKRNGRYYKDFRLPIACSDEEKESLLRLNLGTNMIEVLVREELQLASGVSFRFFHVDDLQTAEHTLDVLGFTDYPLELDKRLEYKPLVAHRRSVEFALNKGVADSTWRGDGLEFDRV